VIEKAYTPGNLQYSMAIPTESALRSPTRDVQSTKFAFSADNFVPTSFRTINRQCRCCRWPNLSKLAATYNAGKGEGKNLSRGNRQSVAGQDRARPTRSVLPEKAFEQTKKME
jgi:hypothetical protein